MFQKIRKRDGEIVTFHASKIRAAIFSASEATGEFEGQTIKWLTGRVLKEVHKPTVDRYVNQVERVKKCPWKCHSKSIWCPG